MHGLDKTKENMRGRARKTAYYHIEGGLEEGGWHRAWGSNESTSKKAEEGGGRQA